jgi:tetratricopeptide (TPR) repeat protein
VRDQRGVDGFTDLEIAIGLAPNTTLPYYFMGLHWRNADTPDFAKAHDAFSLAYLTEADNPALAIEIGRTFQLENQFELARDWYNIAVGLDPDNPEWARVQAAFYADTEYDLEEEGFAAIEAAYRLATDDPDIQASLGRAYFLRDELPQAQELLARAVELDPQSPRARYYFGVLLRRLGDDVAAARNFEVVVGNFGTESGFGALAARALSQINN